MKLSAEDDPKKGLFLTQIRTCHSPQVGMTPLHFAAAEGHTKVAALLVCQDADIEAADLVGGQAGLDLPVQTWLPEGRFLPEHGCNQRAHQF